MKVSKDETGKDNRKEKEMGKPEKASMVREVCKISTGYGDNTKVKDLLEMLGFKGSLFIVHHAHS